MTYLEETLRELICQELKIPNIRAPISSDKGNNDYYVENEREIRRAIREIAQILVWDWNKLERYQSRLSEDCDEPRRDST
jgi:hypothetical protein